jgi:hypothetical protein
VFGRDYQSAEALARTTITGTAAFQNKVTLRTRELKGTYRVGWQCVVDINNATALV